MNVWLFLFNSIVLGIGLAMDAFSVSIADGLSQPGMKGARMNLIAGLFGFFQFGMPLIGWIFVHTLIAFFTAFEPFIPWIALALLLYIGMKMIREADQQEEVDQKLSLAILLLQAVATSIDALSVGFTIAAEPWLYALISCIIIGVVTWLICLVGLVIGKSVGLRFTKKAQLFGGWVLILIGVEIFLTGIF